MSLGFVAVEQNGVAGPAAPAGDHFVARANLPGIGDRILLIPANPEEATVPAGDANGSAALDPPLEWGFLALKQPWHVVNLTLKNPSEPGCRSARITTFR